MSDFTEPSHDALAACRSCDLRQTFGRLPPGGAAQCRRCGDTLHRRPRVGSEATLPLVLTAFFLFLLANAYPLATFELAGRSQSGRLISGVIGLYREGYWELAALVGFTTILAPLLYLLGLICVLIPVALGWRPRGLAWLFRVVLALTPWAMVEVYTLGILVALVKLGDFGQVVPGVALVAFFCLTFVMVALNVHLDREAIWQRIAKTPITQAWRPADSAGTWACHVCKLLVRPLKGDDGGACPRCGAALERRKSNSLKRTWAFLISGYVLYIPANVFPVMTIVSFGEQTTSTIFAGVVELAQGGMLPIAVLVFCASIAIPVLKLVSLTIVAASVQFAWHVRPAARTKLYRVVEGIGRWSMIDVFVISILVALIQLQRVATIEPSLGAICFASVVILTMFAAMSFDPRLIWDRMESRT